MHPSYKLKYFKVRNWPQDWIDEALNIAQDIWKTHYATSAPAAGIPSTLRTTAQSVCSLCLPLSLLSHLIEVL